MVKRMVLKDVIVAIVLVAAVVMTGCKGDGQAPKSTPALKEAIESGVKSVVFFLNPKGGPCRIQNDILQQLHMERAEKFKLVYVSSLKGEDRQAFYDYGIRSLPSLVLLNSQGNIELHFPPGIQSYETLKKALSITN